MHTNPGFQFLHPYPFEKLNKLKEGVRPPSGLSPILLSIGEPKHATPKFILDSLTQNMSGFSNYPTIAGTLELRQAICQWLKKRFHLKKSLDPEQQVLPVTGTREALFAIAQCLTDRTDNPLILMPNPFYQIYEGAALLAGAKPYYIPCTKETNFLPDFNSVPEDIWQRCQILYLCSPGNPTGAVIPIETLTWLISMANTYDFVIASDECYSEIYFDETAPPAGLLQSAARAGHDSYKNCLVFHSLSKRSNLPGMRSGFVAGDKDLIEKFRLYRTYHGCAMPPPVQAASLTAWSDEDHVLANRNLYRQKFATVTDILSPLMNFQKPDGAFYLWTETEIADTEFARQLFAQSNVTVLPGSYLSREIAGDNPGQNRLRMALVASESECVEAANRIASFVQNLRVSRKA